MGDSNNTRIVNLFPTPVGLYNMGEDSHPMNKSLVSDILNEKKIDSRGVMYSNLGGWHSKPGLEGKYESFDILRENVQKCVDIYCTSTNTTIMSNSASWVPNKEITPIAQKFWANVSSSGDTNILHNHVGALLSGVYYPLGEIKDKKASYNYQDWSLNYYNKPFISPGNYTHSKGGGSLIFYGPPHHDNTCHVYPTAGVLILFPSHLSHMVTPFKEDKTRISISFNCFYEKPKSSQQLPISTGPRLDIT